MREIKWTYETCKKESLKYNSRSEFKKKSCSAYSKSIKNKWIESFGEHMKLKDKPDGFWTFENCKIEALKYKTKLEFINSPGWAYCVALKNNWIDEICQHMIKVGNFKKRCIYSCEFSDGFVYVGLTHDLAERWNRRIKDKKDIVYIHMKTTKLKPKIIQLTKYINYDKAIKKEQFYLKKYIKNNWNILNRVKTGSIGGNIIKWTLDECIRESQKYKTLREFREKNRNCLSAIYKNKWNKKILSKYKRERKPNNFWNKKKCFDLAKGCKGKTDFYKKSHGAYASSKLNGWYDEICKLMGW